MAKDIQSSRKTRAVSMLVGMVMSKMQHSYHCKLEQWTTGGNIMMDGKDTGVEDVPATDLCNMLENKGYWVRYAVTPECYPIFVGGK